MGDTDGNAESQSQSFVVPAQAQQRVRLNRSKHGCLVCRQKRIKCSESKPICAQCSAGQRSCMWPNGVRIEKVRSLQPKFESERPIAMHPTPGSTSSSTSPIAAVGFETPKTLIKNSRLELAPIDLSNPPSSVRQGVPDSQNYAHDVEKSTEKRMQAYATGSRRNSDYSIPARHASSLTTRFDSLDSDPLRHRQYNNSAKADDTADRVRPSGPQAAVFDISSASLFSDSFNTLDRLVRMRDMVEIPKTVSLTQFCMAGNPSVTTTIGLIRDTYLSKFVSGPFLISYLDFGSMLAPTLEELDPNSHLSLRDPQRLQSLLTNCVFQEAYVTSLRSTFGTSVHFVRTWLCSLFLLAMSLELGLPSMSLRHLSEAVLCFHQAEVKHILRTADPNDAHRHLLSFLAEATFRLSGTIALLIGEKEAIQHGDMPVLHSARPIDRVLRKTSILKFKAMEILHALIKVDGNHASQNVGSMIDQFSNEVVICQSDLAEALQGIEVKESSNRASPFGLRSFADPSCAHASMSFIFVKLLVVNIVESQNRRSHLKEFFALLGNLLLGARTQLTSLDLFMVLATGSMLDLAPERAWLLDTLRAGYRAGYDLLIPADSIDAILRSVWAGIDARNRILSADDYLRRDFEGLNDLQNNMRFIMR